MNEGTTPQTSAGIHTHAFAHMHSHARIHTQAFAHMHLHACIHTQAFAHMHSHACTHSHAGICTHACGLDPNCRRLQHHGTTNRSTQVCLANRFHVAVTLLLLLLVTIRLPHFHQCLWLTLKDVAILHFAICSFIIRYLMFRGLLVLPKGQGRTNRNQIRTAFCFVHGANQTCHYLI